MGGGVLHGVLHVAAEGEGDLLLEFVDVAEAAALDLPEGDGVVEDGAVVGGVCVVAEDEPAAGGEAGLDDGGEHDVVGQAGAVRGEGAALKPARRGAEEDDGDGAGDGGRDGAGRVKDVAGA